MTSHHRYELATGLNAVAVDVTVKEDLPAAVRVLDVQPPRPTMVLVGGAGGLDSAALDRLRPLFDAGVVPVLDEVNAVAVDGGTQSGVMRILGEARHAHGASFPLIGVVAAGTVKLPDRSSHSDEAADIEPHHTNFLIVPGDEWGAEASWIAEAAGVIAGSAPSVTVLVNGGEITYQDADFSVQARRRVVVIRGSGRTADALAAALDGDTTNERAVKLVRTELLTAVPLDQPATLAARLREILGDGRVE